MTPTLDYANTMLDIYLNDDDWQPEAIAHYLNLAIAERVKADRERELKEMYGSEYNSNSVVFSKHVVSNTTNTRTRDNGN